MQMSSIKVLKIASKQTVAARVTLCVVLPNPPAVFLSPDI